MKGQLPDVVVTASSDFPVDEKAVREVLGDRAVYRMLELNFQTPTPEYERDLAALIGDARALFVRPGNISRGVIEQAETLGIIAVHGAGVDQVDVAAATDCGVLVTNVPGANANAVTEAVFGLLLALFRRIPRAVEVVKREKGWGEGRSLGWELRGRTMGVVGAGNIGGRVTAIARAFGMEVLSFDPVVPPDAIAASGARPVDFDSLLRQSDVITLHVPLIPATQHLIGEKQLGMMKKGAVLVNTSRGPVVDGEALYAALASGHLGGAALDVMEKEPPAADDPLRGLENVVLTPHLGGSTLECLTNIARGACEDILLAFAGERPRYLVNPVVLEKRPRLWRA